jgi:hypothetical protein
MPLDVMAAATKPRLGGGFVVVNFSMKMNDFVVQLMYALKVTQAAQAQEVNKKQQHHHFQQGDRIMLNMRNLPLGYGHAAQNALKGREDVNGVDTDGQGARQSEALRQKYMVQFTLGNQHGENTFELDDIPDHLWIHKMFIVSLFEQCEIAYKRLQAPGSPSTISRVSVERTL